MTLLLEGGGGFTGGDWKTTPGMNERDSTCVDLQDELQRYIAWSVGVCRASSHKGQPHHACFQRGRCCRKTSRKKRGVLYLGTH